MKLYLQAPRNKMGDKHMLIVFSSGRIICDCINNLFCITRDYNSTCRHAETLRRKIIYGDISDYDEIFIHRSLK